MPPKGKGGGGGGPRRGPSRQSSAGLVGGPGSTRAATDGGDDDHGLGDKALGLLGAVGSALSAPPQVVFRAGKGLGELARGDMGGFGTLAGAAGEVATVGQLGGDVTLTEALGVDKLPYGLETGGQLVFDPLNFLTFGAGTAAKQAVKTVAREAGEELAEKITKQGVKALTDAEKDVVRSVLSDTAAKGGSKNAVKTADKQYRALSRRGQGGVNAVVPFSDTGVSLLSGATAARIGEKTGLTAAKNAVKGTGAAQFLGRAFSPGKAVADASGRQAADEFLDAMTERAAAEGKMRADDQLRVKSVLKDFEDQTGRAFDIEDSRRVNTALEMNDGNVAMAMDALPDHYHRAVRALDDMRRGTTKGQVDENLLAVGRDSDTYMHRLRTPEAAEALGGTADEVEMSVQRTSARSNARQAATQARRVAPDSAQAEVNEAIRLVQAGEPIPDGMLRDEKFVAEFTESVRRRIDAIEAEAAEIAQRNLDPRTGELTLGAQRKIAADAEAVRRLKAEVAREARRVDAVDGAAERAATGVAAAHDARTGLLMGQGHAAPVGPQTPKGAASRAKQAALRQRRLNRSAAVANATGRAEARTTAKITAGEVDRQASALASAVKSLDEMERAAADRAARYQDEANRRLVRQDEKRLSKLDEQREKAQERLAEKTQQAEDEIRAVVIDVAQRLDAAGIDRLYSEDAVASIIDRGGEAARAVSTAQMLGKMRGIIDDKGRQLLMSADDVAEGAPLPSSYVEVDMGPLGKFHADPATAAELNKFTAVVGQDGAVKAFEKFIDTANKWWKTMTTVYPIGGLAFGLRNARSNAFMAWADGMAPHWFGKGLDFQKRVYRIKQDFAADIADLGVDAVLKRELGDADFRIYDGAIKNGVLSEGYFDIEVVGAPTLSVKGAAKPGGKARRAGRFVFSQHGGMAQAGRKGNQAIEHNARLSHYLYSVERFGNITDAAKRTNTVLIDYSRKTDFERRVIARAVPFWTFMSRNVPLQFKALVENPARIVMPEKLSQAVTDPLPENSPEYQRRGGARVLKFGPMAGMISTPERPFQAAVKALEPASQMLGALTPGDIAGLDPEKGFGQAMRSTLSQFGGVPGAPIKWAAEEAGNVDLFTGFRLKDTEGIQRALVEAFPPLGRMPRALARQLPAAIVEARRKKKQPTLADIANALGIKVEPESKG